MNEIVTRIEVLFLAAIIASGAMIIPASTPRVDVRQSAVAVVDAFVKLKVDCKADSLTTSSAGELLSADTIAVYRKRLYSEEAPSRPEERWLLIRATPVSALLLFQGKLQETFVGYHDMWADAEPSGDPEQLTLCPNSVPPQLSDLLECLN